MLFEIVLGTERRWVEMLWVWRRLLHWGCHGGAEGPTMPKCKGTTTLSRTQKSNPIHTWQLDRQPPCRRYFPQLHLAACLQHDKGKVLGWGEDVGRLGLLVEDWTEAGWRGARPCLGLPCLQPTYLFWMFLLFVYRDKINKGGLALA